MFTSIECTVLHLFTNTNQDEWLPLLGQHKYMYPYLNVNQITQYSTLYTKKDFRKDVTAKTFESRVYVRILYHHEVRKWELFESSNLCTNTLVQEMFSQCD